AQPVGLREFLASPLGFAVERIGCAQKRISQREGRNRAPTLFQPRDRFLSARLKQMHLSDRVIPIAYLRIAGAEAERLLMQFDRFVEQSDPELAPAETRKSVDPTMVERERLLIFRDALLVAAGRAQHLAVGVM